MSQGSVDTHATREIRHMTRWLTTTAVWFVLSICLTLSYGRVGARPAFAAQATGHDISAAPAQENDFDLSRNTITVTKQTVPADCGRPWKFEATSIKDFVLTGGESLPFPMLTSGHTYTFYETNLPNGWALDLRCEGGAVSTWTVISRTHIAGEGDDSCGGEHGGTSSDHEKKERYDIGVSVFLAPDEAVTCTFLNQRKPQIRAMRYADLDGDGILAGDEAPQMDWRYRLFKWMEGAWKPVKETQITNIDGMAKFGGLKAGAYRVCEIPQAGWYSTLPGALAVPDPSDGDMVCQSVTLPDEYGYLAIVPFAGAHSGSFILHTTTDPAGGSGFQFSHTFDSTGAITLTGSESHTFAELPAGTYHIAQSSTPAGWEMVQLACDDEASAIPSVVDLVHRSVAVVVEPGETVTCTYAYTLVGGAMVGDRVWLDTIPDGVQDDPAIEPGMGGIVVTLHGSDGQAVVQTTTDGDGLYRIENVIPGDYYLTFANAAQEYVWTTPHQGSDSAMDSDAADPVDAADLERRSLLFTLGAAQVDLTLDAGLASVLGAGSASLGGSAWLDDDRNGIRGEEERGAPAVTVHLFRVNAGAGEVEDNVPLAETRTDDDGRYRFDALDAGRYRLKVVLPTHHWLSPIGQSGDPLHDSYFDGAGVSPVIYLPPATADTRWDVGLIYVEPTALDPIEEIVPNDWLYLPAVTYTSE